MTVAHLPLVQSGSSCALKSSRTFRSSPCSAVFVCYSLGKNALQNIQLYVGIFICTNVFVSLLYYAALVHK